MKFKPGDFVEDISKGDLPFLVTVVEREHSDEVWGRYTIETRDGTVYRNMPGYLLVPARPASQSKHGAK